MKKLILNIVTLGLLFGVAVVNKNEEPKHLEVQDVLTEKEDTAGSRTRKYANETPEFKVSEVKAQVSEVYQDAGGNDRINIRFVAGIDTYTYSNAKFNLTIKDGETLVKEIEKPITVAYSAIEVNNDVLTAAEAFGDGYNYMISYALKNVPSSAWDYTFEVTAGVKTEESDYVNSEVATKNIEEIKAADEIESPYVYLFGPATPQGGWDNPFEMPKVSDDPLTYEVTTDLNAGDFIINEVKLRTDTSGFKLKPASGNFNVEMSGNYTITLTYQDMSEVTGWAKTIDANNKNNDSGFFYKITPNFEIIEQTTIQKLFLNGKAAANNWTVYVQMTKKAQDLFTINTTLSASTEGFIVTAQENTSSSGYVFKKYNSSTNKYVNLSVATAGQYKISISLVDPQDSSWEELRDEKGNYTESIYIQISKYESTGINLLRDAGLTPSAEVSDYKNDASKGDKVFNGATGNNNRWETSSTDPQWIEINLGTQCEINTIEIQWHSNAQAKEYVISYSIDGQTWYELEKVFNPSAIANRLDVFEFETISAQYIKIYAEQRVNNYGYSIGELYIRGTVK